MKHTAIPKLAAPANSSQDSLKALLLDPNPCVSSLAMEQMLQSPTQCRNFIAAHQDSADLTLRKCAHQLAGCLRMKTLQDEFVHRFEQGQLDAWDAAMLIDQLYDQRSSSAYLQELFLDLLDQFAFVGNLNMEKLANYMKERKFGVPPHPILNIYNYLVGDVLENTQGTALVLCLLARQLARSNSYDVRLCLCNGKFCLVDRQRNLLDPTEEWKVTRKAAQESMHLCTNQEIVRVYLTQLLASSIMVWEVFDVHIFLQLLQRIDGIGREQLPYPYGNFLAPAPDPEP